MNKIKIPRRLKQRPQWRGLPIPYIALIDDNNQPDFRVTDMAKRFAVMRDERCQLCGEPLGKWCFFVGGTEAAKANQYFEPAAHLDCLIYAMKVCPFIVGRMEHVDLGKIEKQYSESAKITRIAGGLEIKADDCFSATRNPWWVIKKARRWNYAKTPQGTILIIPDVIKQTEPLHPETMSGSDWKEVATFLESN